ncbi:MAG TPA: ABC transporter ATP-binding protein, partial [Pantoea ananatis]|nr:ABC transporter ATP-binding protein [Pantoea ananatis]
MKFFYLCSAFPVSGDGSYRMQQSQTAPARVEMVN